MKITIFSSMCIFIVAANSLSAMDFFAHNKKKSPTEKCYLALQNNNAKKFKKAIAQGADINYIPKGNWRIKENLLQRAVHKKNISIIKILLNAKNIDINSYHPSTIPALHSAVFSGDFNIVTLFLNHPATNINLMDGQGQTCLFTAFDSFSRSSQQIGQELLNKKIDTAIANEKGNTILHYACQKDSADWVNLILSIDNPPLNTQNNRGDTPLHISCRTNSCCVMKIILSSNHRILTYLRNMDGHSVLDIALSRGYDTIVSLLFDRHLDDLIAENRYVRGVFDYAIRTENIRVLQRVLPSPYINFENPWGLTPLMIASQNGKKRIIKLLLKQKNCMPLCHNRHNRIALHYASESGHLPCVKKLCKSGGINEQDAHKNTPLHLACINQYIDIIDYLIKKGAHTLIRNKRSFIPFMIIYRSNIHDKIKKRSLINLIHAHDENNNTLFHIFSQMHDIPYDNYDYDDYLQFLFNQGLDVYAPNHKPLLIEMPQAYDYYDYDDYVQFLFNQGLNAHVRYNETFLIETNKPTALDKMNLNDMSSKTVSRLSQSFWRVISDNRSYDLIREVLKSLPKDLRITILIWFYKLNITTIFAKICKKHPCYITYPLYQQVGLQQNLHDDVHYFPLLYRPAVISAD